MARSQHRRGAGEPCGVDWSKWQLVLKRTGLRVHPCGMPAAPQAYTVVDAARNRPSPPWHLLPDVAVRNILAHVAPKTYRAWHGGGPVHDPFTALPRLDSRNSCGDALWPQVDEGELLALEALAAAVPQWHEAREVLAEVAYVYDDEWEADRPTRPVHSGARAATLELPHFLSRPCQASMTLHTVVSLALDVPRALDVPLNDDEFDMRKCLIPDGFLASLPYLASLVLRASDYGKLVFDSPRAVLELAHHSRLENIKLNRLTLGIGLMLWFWVDDKAYDEEWQEALAQLAAAAPPRASRLRTLSTSDPWLWRALRAACGDAFPRLASLHVAGLGARDEACADLHVPVLERLAVSYALGSNEPDAVLALAHAARTSVRVLDVCVRREKWSDRPRRRRTPVPPPPPPPPPPSIPARQPLCMPKLRSLRANWGALAAPQIAQLARGGGCAPTLGAVEVVLANDWDVEWATLALLLADLPAHVRFVSVIDGWRAPEDFEVAAAAFAAHIGAPRSSLRRLVAHPPALLDALATALAPPPECTVAHPRFRGVHCFSQVSLRATHVAAERVAVDMLAQLASMPYLRSAHIAEIEVPLLDADAGAVRTLRLPAPGTSSAARAVWRALPMARLVEHVDECDDDMGGEPDAPPEQPTSWRATVSPRGEGRLMVYSRAMPMDAGRGRVAVTGQLEGEQLSAEDAAIVQRAARWWAAAVAARDARKQRRLAEREAGATRVRLAAGFDDLAPPLDALGRPEYEREGEWPRLT